MRPRFPQRRHRTHVFRVGGRIEVVDRVRLARLFLPVIGIGKQRFHAGRPAHIQLVGVFLRTPAREEKRAVRSATHFADARLRRLVERGDAGAQRRIAGESPSSVERAMPGVRFHPGADVGVFRVFEARDTGRRRPCRGMFRRRSRREDRQRLSVATATQASARQQQGVWQTCGSSKREWTMLCRRAGVQVPVRPGYRPQAPVERVEVANNHRHDDERQQRRRDHPPMIARPIGACCSAPSPGRARAAACRSHRRGGHQDRAQPHLPAASSASLRLMPLRWPWFAKSTSRIAFLVTSPSGTHEPIIEKMFSVGPVSDQRASRRRSTAAAKP
jgi:hypothetical protein